MVVSRVLLVLCSDKLKTTRLKETRSGSLYAVPVFVRYVL